MMQIFSKLSTENLLKVMQKQKSSLIVVQSDGDDDANIFSLRAKMGYLTSKQLGCLEEQHPLFFE